MFNHKSHSNLDCSRTVVGTLKGYDQLLNLVMDDLEETLRGELSSRCFRP